jgi:hypothetical protein
MWVAITSVESVERGGDSARLNSHQGAGREAKPVLTTLRYDGKAYVLPNGFSGL